MIDSDWEIGDDAHMDGLQQIGKELKTFKGILRVFVAFAATLLGCFGLMELAVLLMMGGLNEYFVVGGMFVLIVLFLSHQWSCFCTAMVDSIFGTWIANVTSAKFGCDFGCTIPTRTLTVPLAPPRNTRTA